MEATKGKKILLVVTKSNWGGAQTYVYALATELHRMGADVSVALGGTGLPGATTGLLAEKLQYAGIRTIVLSSFARDISIMREFKAFLDLVRVVRKAKPDVLHLNSSKAGGLGALAGRLIGTKHILYTAHGWAHREPRPFLGKMLVWWSSWATVFLCHKIIVVSEYDYRDAPVIFSRKKLVVIHNGIAPFELLSRDAARAELHNMGVTADAPIWILMISELIRNKAVDVAIKAFARIADAFPNAILVDFGEGELKEELKQLIAEKGLQNRAFLLGFVPNGKTYLRAGDALLMSSYKEGFPMTLLEAGMSTTPVIATRTGGIPELIEDRKTGLLFPVGDDEALAKAFTEILSESSEREQLANALHERVTKDFSIEKMVSETLRAYS